MSNTLSIATASEGLGSDGGAHSPAYQPHRRPAEPAQAAEAPPPAADPGQRLVIEEIDGALVYTVIDRATGAVVARTSRDAVSKMGAQPDYAAGALIRTSA
jgi:hypothetical protein